MKISTLLVFAIALTFLFIAPAFLSSSFPFYSLIKNGDVLDLFTPLILIPLSWALFNNASGKPLQRKETIVFLILAAL
jgi:hypothetical protein